MGDTRIPPKFTGLLAEIAEAAGEHVAAKVAAHCGGTRVDIPARPRADHWLVKLLGEEDAAKVSNYLAILDADGRRKGHTPRSPSRWAPWRSATSRAGLFWMSWRKGRDVRAAARAAGVHERTVWRYRAQFRKQGLLP